jgi:hypothetical protein
MYPVSQTRLFTNPPFQGVPGTRRVFADTPWTWLRYFWDYLFTTVWETSAYHRFTFMFWYHCTCTRTPPEGRHERPESTRVPKCFWGSPGNRKNRSNNLEVSAGRQREWWTISCATEEA